MRKVLYLALALVFLNACSRPAANFRMAEEARAAKSITFTNQTEEAETYLWEFGDGETSTELSPDHRYMSSGTYTVKLTATNAKGKSGSREQQVTVLPGPVQ